MRRMLLVIAVFGAVSLAGSVLAQGPGGPGGFGKKKGPPPAAADADQVKDLEATLHKLRRQLADVEAQLQKAKSGAEPEGDKPAAPPEGFGKKKGKGKGFGPGFGPGGGGQGFGRGFGPGGGGQGFGRGFGPGGGGQGFGPPGFAPKGKGKRFGPDAEDKKEPGKAEEKRVAPPVTPAAPSIEDRLDRLLRELQDIRRELMQK